MGIRMRGTMVWAVLATGLCCAAAEAQDWGTAAGVCQGALPAFETALRKRPLAVSNEGERNAFVTCALRQSYLERGDSVRLYFTNRTGTEATVQCTLLSNHDLVAWNARYVAGLLTLAPSEMYWLYWDADPVLDGSPGFQAPSVSCSLPPGTEINLVEYHTLDMAEVPEPSRSGSR